MTRTEDAKMRAQGVVEDLLRKIKVNPDIDPHAFYDFSKKILKKWRFPSINAFMLVAIKNGIIDSTFNLL